MTLNLPNHIAVIMDGNGRWAEQRNLPRIEGHRQGLEAVKVIVSECLTFKVPALTLFAFGTDNWLRPAPEVSFLMDLFLTMLDQEIKQLHEHGVRLRIIGDTSRFSPTLQQAISKAESLTAENDKLMLNIAANYGGRWDILQATQKIAQSVVDGDLAIADITEDCFQSHVQLGDLPPPDLFIRTSGEQRISNFILWDLKYTELYFTETCWPDFRQEAFLNAMTDYQRRLRKFGKIAEQLVLEEV